MSLVFPGAIADCTGEMLHDLWTRSEEHKTVDSRRQVLLGDRKPSGISFAGRRSSLK